MTNKRYYGAKSVACNVVIDEYEPITLKANISYEGQSFPLNAKIKPDRKDWFNPFAWFDRFAV